MSSIEIETDERPLQPVDLATVPEPLALPAAVMNGALEYLKENRVKSVVVVFFTDDETVAYASGGVKDHPDMMEDASSVLNEFASARRKAQEAEDTLVL